MSTSVNAASTTHAARHAAGQPDAVTPAAIGANATANNGTDFADRNTTRFNLANVSLRAKVMSTTNQALTGKPTIDGYTLTNNDLILLTGQTTTHESGIWKLPPSGSGSWIRPNEFPSGGVVSGGQLCAVASGTTNGGTVWVLISNATVTIDTTAQVWQAANPPNSASLNSPAFTGTPTAPTAGSGVSTTQLATTAFVHQDAAIKASNGSDFADAGTTRWNLGVPSLSAKAVQTTNQALTGQPNIDGYATTNDDVVLLIGNTTAHENGVWKLPHTGTGAWARPTDFPSGGVLTFSKLCLVSSGTVLNGTIWSLILSSPATIDTTSLTWQLAPANLANIALTGQLSDGEGEIVLDSLPPGGEFNIYWDTGTSEWWFPGPHGTGASAHITTRPSSRTDITMKAVGGAAASPPSFAITGDLQFPTS